MNMSKNQVIKHVFYTTVDNWFSVCFLVKKIYLW